MQLNPPEQSRTSARQGSMTTSAFTPVEWLNSLGNFLEAFYEEQCSAVVRKSKVQVSASNTKRQSPVKRTPSTNRKYVQETQIVH
jgi:hypothetical protein